MSENENPTKRLGDFEIIRELGRGGMGIVYETRQALYPPPSSWQRCFCVTETTR